MKKCRSRDYQSILSPNMCVGNKKALGRMYPTMDMAARERAYIIRRPSHTSELGL